MTANYRIKINFLFVFAATSTLLFFGGCAGNRQYKEGIKLLENSQYNIAVERLEEAVELASENKQYKDAEKYRLQLEIAKKKASEYYYNQARYYLDKTQLQRAKTNIDKALKYTPDNRIVSQLYDSINRKMENVITLRNQAVAMNGQQRYDDAVQVMQDVLRQWETIPDGKEDLETFRQNAFNYHLDAAMQYVKTNQLDSAQQQCDTAAIYNPDSNRIQPILQIIFDRRKSHTLVEAAKEKIPNAQYAKALEDLTEAKRLFPEMDGLDDLITETKISICDINIAQGQNLLKNKDYAAALKCFYNSRKLLNGYGGIDGLIEQACGQLAEIHIEAAEEYEKKQLYGNAVLHSALAAGYRGNSKAIREAITRNSGVIKQKVAYTIGYDGFTGTPEQQDILKNIDADSLKYLLQVKPESISIVNRTNIRDADAIISGKIIENKIIVTSTGKTATSDYIAGTKQIANPEYEKACRKVNSAIDDAAYARRLLENEIDRQRRRCPCYFEQNNRAGRHDTPDNRQPCDCDESLGLRNARKRLERAETELWTEQAKRDNIPQLITVPLEMKYNYQVYTYTKTANIKCQIELKDARTGSLLLADTVSGKYEVSDKYIEDNAAKNVQGDPLNLPQEEQMYREAVEKLQNQINGNLKIATQKHSYGYYTEMNNQIAGDNTEAAIENAFMYLYSYPTGANANQNILSFIGKTLGVEKDIVDISEVLSAHCGLLNSPVVFKVRSSN